jgi:D-alanyl-D-alanine carboxypeptidase
MTPSDLARWDIAFMQKKILSPASYEQFTHEMHLKNGDLTHYALGLQIGEFANMPTISHSGEVSGFLSSNRMFPTRDGAVIVLSNQDVVNLIGPLSQQISREVFVTEHLQPHPKIRAKWKEF